MPRPQRPRASELQLQREVNTLGIKLLQVNAALRVKTIYCERLELLLRQRNERVDTLYAQLERAYTINRRLEAEAEHLAALIANDHHPQTHILAAQLWLIPAVHESLASAT
jgi:hypothetical protein